MTDPAEGGNSTEIVIQAADKVERRLLHVSVGDRLDEVMRDNIREWFGVIV